jgi:hypothetical protein
MIKDVIMRDGGALIVLISEWLARIARGARLNGRPARALKVAKLRALWKDCKQGYETSITLITR